MKSFFKFAPLAAMALMVSCNGSDAGPLYGPPQTFSNCYAIVTDMQTSEISVSQPVTSNLLLDWTNMTAQTTFSGLTISGNTFPLLTLTDLKWGAMPNELWCHTTGTPSASLTTNQAVSVANLTFEWSDRLDIPNREPSEYKPAFFYSFDLDGRYHLTGSLTPFTFWGTTTVTSDGTEPFLSNVKTVVAEPDFKDMTMSVLIEGAQFAQGMPALEIKLSGIPMTLIDSGDAFAFEAERIIPTIADVPYENYECTNVSGTLDPRSGMTFTFDCNVRGMKIYNVTTQPTVFGYRSNGQRPN